MVHRSKPVKIPALAVLLILTVSALPIALGVPKPVIASTSQTWSIPNGVGDPTLPCLPSSSVVSTALVQTSDKSKPIPGAVLPSVADGTALGAGPLPPSMTINLELVFSIKNPQQFSSCLASIETPGSPNYRHFLNETTLAPYLPSAGDKASVAAFLRHKGFTVSDGPSPLVIRFAGTVKAVESAFGVELRMFEQNSTRFFAATSDPTLPLNFAVMTQGIVGLDNYTVAKPLESPCGYDGSADCPQGVQVGYNMTGLYSQGFNGSGVTVAVVDEPGDSNPQGAIDTFDSQYGLPNVKLSVLYPDGRPAYYDPGWGLETALDIEAVHSMAPGAGITLVYGNGRSGFTNLDDLFDAIDYVAVNHTASIVTDSWGTPEGMLSSSQLSSYDSRLMVDAAQGLTILFASGDSGSYETDFPASDPNVLAVGATNLNLTGCTGVTCTGYGSEEGASISGGGYSGYFPEPSWQRASLGTLPGRGFPDVSALGLYPYFWVYMTYAGGAWYEVAGTSLSSPLWAGFLAVALQFEGRGSVGNIDPLIYKLGSGASYSSVFHDIITGSNGNYSAGPGWDPVTGWGSPIADQLAHALATMPAISLSPSLGKVGASVAISGFNLLASSRLAVMYDGSTTGMPTNCTTDAAGNINSGCTFTVPLSAGGIHNVTVTDGTHSPMAIFVVPPPSILLSPSWGIVGTTVTITGIALLASRNLTVAYDNSTAGMPTDCTTDAVGNINSGCTFVVPPSAFGSHTVTVADGINRPTATFTVPVPAIFLFPYWGFAGTSVNITGWGLAASRNLTVAYDNSTAGMPTDCTTDAVGNINSGCTFVVPRSTFGYHTVTVADGTNSPTAYFYVQPPYIYLSPWQGVVGSPVTIFGWGFVASHNLTVTYDNSTAGMPTDCTTDAYGSINSGCTFTVPPSAVGAHTVTVTDGTNNLTATFYIPAPSIYLYPSWVVVGSNVTIFGWGFVASHNLTVTYDNSTAGMPTDCTTDEYGDINSSCTFTVPPSAVGAHTVTVTDGTNGPTAILFIPAPYIYLSPSRGFVGSNVTIFGWGFVASHNLTVTYDNSTAGMPTKCTTDAYGYINQGQGCTFTVPPSAVGAHTVTVTDGTNNLTALFTVPAPSIFLSPSSGIVDTRVDITGTGFVASHRLTVTYDNSTAGMPTNCATDEYGDINSSCMFRVPFSTAGPHSVTVTDDTNSATATFEVSPAITIPGTIPVGDYPDAVAVNPSTNRIYVADTFDDNVSVINGRTNLIIANFTAGNYPSAVAVNPSTNRIYVADTFDDNVSVINGRTNRVVANITVGGGPSGVAVNPSTNTVYVTDSFDNNVSVINGRTNRVVANISVGDCPSGIDVDPRMNTVYVANSCDNTISVISGITDKVTEVIVVGDLPSGVAVNTETDIVYVTSSYDNTVSVINGRTNLVVANITVGGGPSGIAVNSRMNTVYVANSYDSTISVISGITDKVNEVIGVGDYPSGVAVNTKTDTVYVTNSYDGTVSVISRSMSMVTETITVGGYPSGVAVNPSTNRIYVASLHDNTTSVTVINGKTNLAIANISVGAGSYATALAVNPSTNRIYFASFYGNPTSLIVINGRTNLVIANITVGGYATALAVNPSTNRIYVASLHDNTTSVTVINGRTNLVIANITVGAGGYASALAVNPSTNRIYVANFYDNTVSVINGRTNLVIANITVGGYATALAVNPSTNRIYVGHFLYNTTSVIVINGRTNLAIANITVGIGPSAVTVNTKTNNVYVASTYDNTVSVINGKTNQITETIIVEGSPIAVAANTRTNKVYIASASDNTVSVVSLAALW